MQLTAGVCAPCSVWWWPPFHQDVKIHTILDLKDTPKGKVIVYQWDYILISGVRDKHAALFADGARTMQHFMRWMCCTCRHGLL